MPRPSFEDVPEHWKAPFGPYRQAPAEYGGEWWLVNPFTTAEPWLFEERRKKIDELPEGFLEIFGPRPKFKDFHGVPKANFAFRAAVVRWRQDLRYFQRAGFPEWATAKEREESDGIFQRWGMGAPRYYEGRYGWMARFVDSEIKDYDISAWTALNWSHGAIAHYQIALIGRGIRPERFHPLFPDHVRGSDSENKEER